MKKIGQHGVRQISEQHKRVLLASYAASVMRRNWFDTAQPTPNRMMSLFLMTAYAFAEFGEPLHRERACVEMGLDKKEGLKKVRNYIKDAEQMGWLAVSSSLTDKRVRLLEPTEALKKMIEDSLSSFVADIRSLLHALDAPQLHKRGHAKKLGTGDRGKEPDVSNHLRISDGVLSVWEHKMSIRTR